MATTTLRNLLKSLCNSSSCWNYAVLWKLRPGNPTILTWEDGCFGYPKPSEPLLSISDDIYCGDAGGAFSSTFKMSSPSGSSSRSQIGLLVADMSLLQYAFGEGIVGIVACTEIHSWVSFSNVVTGEVNPEFVPQCPEEWLLQFASGIKTILLVPVLPHGVLQLGSSEEVTEDIEMVAQIKRQFSTLNSFGKNSAPFSSKRDLKAQFSSLVTSRPTGHSDASSTIEVSLVKCEESNESVTINNPKFPKDNLLEALNYENQKDNVLQMDLEEISTPSESMNASQLDMMESRLFELSSLMEELQAYTDLNVQDVELFAESLNEILRTYPGDMQRPSCGVEAINDADHKNRSSLLIFPKDSELHKALGSAFQTQANEKLWDLSFLVGDCDSSKFICNKDFGDRTEPSRLTEASDAENLLEAVIAKGYHSIDHTSLGRSTTSSKSCTNSSENLGGSTQPENRPEISGLVGSDSVKWCQFTSCVSQNTDSTTVDALDSMMSTVHKERQERVQNDMQRQNEEKMPRASRRARPVDNQKPRPRDRQLIQDRVKELRELVPNGAKCSIDGLLDRTIKHMLYLRSITDQAEKLKQWVHQEVTYRKNCRSTSGNSTNEHGMSRAYEYGSNLQLCPIVVEDLAHPGHMIIEMLCDDHGLFLEIAQVICGLELTILKGVIEVRSSDTWAHFIVEACKGFHRLDIFWPLMQLLHKKKRPISSRSSAIPS
ncbi:hypothetical protein Tsubulata_002785 [Turnera subulata]|uniref:BHLH domain-containing protein n=1 Tax=Turnera subulata TaxID=218843 RepID=A0A9Q0JC20_9ROSI|nr:hypothetical protein Tsubulata_002785 [Turnera subulata]